MSPDMLNFEPSQHEEHSATAPAIGENARILAPVIVEGSIEPATLKTITLALNREVAVPAGRAISTPVSPVRGEAANRAIQNTLNPTANDVHHAYNWFVTLQRAA